MSDTKKVAPEPEEPKAPEAKAEDKTLNEKERAIVDLIKENQKQWTEKLQDLEARLQPDPKLEEQIKETEEAIASLQTQYEELRRQKRDEPAQSGEPFAYTAKSLIETALKDENFKYKVETHLRGGNWRRFGGVVTAVKRFFPVEEEKTTISSSTIGSSTPGIITPARVRDFIAKPRRRMTLRDLLPSRTTDSASVEYIREDASPVASPQVEASAKFETGQTYTIVEAKVRTIAGWVPVTRQIMSDWSALERLIRDSLLFALAKEEEDQLLNGDGLNENLSGIQTQATAYAGTYNVAADTKLDRLRHAILEAEDDDEMIDFIVLNPVDLHDIELLKTEDSGSANTGMYIVGDPTGVLLEAKTLWGRVVVQTTAQTSGTFLVGARNMAEIFDRENATIDISTEHSDYFVKNMVAIRAEERIALAVYRTSAFVSGTF